jgi:hypothetical protein
MRRFRADVRVNGMPGVYHGCMFSNDRVAVHTETGRELVTFHNIEEMKMHFRDVDVTSLVRITFLDDPQ